MAPCHRAFREKLNLTMPLLADFNPKGMVSRADGARIEAVDHGNGSSTSRTARSSGPMPRRPRSRFPAPT